MPPIKEGGGANTANSGKRWQVVQQLSFDNTNSPPTSRRTCEGCKGRSRSQSFIQMLRSRPSIDLAQGSLETQLPQPTTAAAGSAIDVQLFPLAGRTPLHSPKQKIQKLHVAQASPHCTSYRGMQMVLKPKCRNYVTDRQAKALTCVGSRTSNSLKRMHPRLSQAAAQSELTAPAPTGEGIQKNALRH